MAALCPAPSIPPLRNAAPQQEVARELVQLVKTQQPTGVLFYEWSFSDNYVFVEEGYTDVDAVAEHNLLVSAGQCRGARGWERRGDGRKQGREDCR